MSQEPKLASPKVADTAMFGDDAWFLSGLGISFDQPVKASVQPTTIEKDEENIAEALTEQEDAISSESPVRHKEDIEPTIKEARIISKWTTTPYPTEWKKAKTKDKPAPPQQDAVGQLIQQKTKEQQDLDRSHFEKKKPFWWAGRGAHKGKPWQNHHWWSQSGWAAITIWSTHHRKQTQQSQPTTTKVEKNYKVSDSLKKKETIVIGDAITVKEFSEKMWVPLPEVMKVLLSNKILVGAQTNIDFDTALLIATEFEVTVTKEQADMNVEDLLSGDLQAILATDKWSDTLESRPPIVTIMGHVDHGKTKLLDYLRSSNVVAGEAWGITQSIWASQTIRNGQKITFIDTPGHELFTSLRARGSKITDIVIIVVSLDDGVKQQTIEAINHAKDAWVPIIVALTKMDLGLHRIDEIKGQLAAQWLQPEDWWGDIMCVPCSAISGQWVDDLLDCVLLQYEMLERQYNPKRWAVGVVVEAHKDSKQWVTTSLLIMTWTLRIGDIVVIHNTFGKVRKMTDRSGKEIKVATWWDPVMILWMSETPEPWRIAEVVVNEKDANKKVAMILDHEHATAKDTVLHSLLDKISKWDKVQVKLILKADSFGSLEAVKYATSKVTWPDNVEISIAHADIWAITDSDILFAQAAKGILIGYNVDASGTLKKKAEQLKVPIKSFDIIYQYIDYLDQLTQWMIEKEKVAVTIGKLEVLGVFYKKWKDIIFWGKVLEWKIRNNSYFKVTNRTDDANEDGEWGKEIKGTVTSLQREKDNVNEVAQWYECGMKAKINKKLEVGDIIEYFVWEEH
jgi:translation initiation factor IF-2